MDENLVTDAGFYVAIGNKIRMARKQKNIDQETFAKFIQLSRTSVINIEKGRQRPSIYQIWLMAYHLQVPITDLIPPLDLQVRIDSWTEIVEKNNLIADPDEKKALMGFITATRIPK